MSDAPMLRKTRLARTPEQDMLNWWCPGCNMPHSVAVTGSKAWGWNGNRESPTITPSVLCRWTNEELPAEICHCFITDGRIQFLGDCTHSLAGQTVPIPEWPTGRYESIGFEVLPDGAKPTP